MSEPVLWEFRVAVSARGRAIMWTIVVVGLVAPAAFSLLYWSAGWGAAGNPWWNPFMIALVLGPAPALLCIILIRESDKHVVVRADGRLVERRGRRFRQFDLNAYDRVTVKRKISQTHVPSGPTSRVDTTTTLVVNGWVSGQKKPTAFPVGVPAKRDQEAGLREAIKDARAGGPRSDRTSG